MDSTEAYQNPKQYKVSYSALIYWTKCHILSVGPEFPAADAACVWMTATAHSWKHESHLHVWIYTEWISLLKWHDNFFLQVAVAHFIPFL